MSETTQQPLIGDQPKKKPRTIRKTRIDKGRKRKPAPGERETWRAYFRNLTISEQTFELGYLTAIANAEMEAAESGADIEEAGID